MIEVLWLGSAVVGLQRCTCAVLWKPVSVAKVCCSDFCSGHVGTKGWAGEAYTTSIFASSSGLLPN